MATVTKIIVVKRVPKIRFGQGIPGPVATDAQIIAALDTLEEYNSDSDATTGGATWYVTGSGHESLPYGVIKKALI